MGANPTEQRWKAEISLIVCFAKNGVLAIMDLISGLGETRAEELKEMELSFSVGQGKFSKRNPREARGGEFKNGGEEIRILEQEVNLL